ncbi:hypothetical protein VTN77DRAFT_505 [Rasamsonia byssochlamydoides]|uniref:uncharacterized protein n=1 Tax=Rasamsonia byssochlamydoides TaxID=89139 RepID=UPI003744581C
MVQNQAHSLTLQGRAPLTGPCPCGSKRTVSVTRDTMDVQLNPFLEPKFTLKDPVGTAHSGRATEMSCKIFLEYNSHLNAICPGILGKGLSPYGLRESLASPQVRRKLSAATQEAVFHYLHEANDAVDDSIFAASLSVKSREPILVVEELETELKDVVCSTSQMSLFFHAPGGLDAVKESFNLNGSFIVVTAHDGCNLDGERATYRASKAVIDAANSAVHIEVSRCEWRDAFIDTHVSFFRRQPSENQMHRRTLERRQQSQVTSTTTIALTGSVTPTVSFPTAPSVTSELPSTATKTLNVQMVDELIFPPQNPLAEVLIPQGITLSCKNCSIGGTIEISEASFSLHDSDNAIDSLIDTVNETIAFFEHGSVEVVATGLFAHIELEVAISASQDLKSLNISLPTIPLSPFEIPGVLAFGPLIAPELVAGITLAESLNFTYGMNLSVPDNSRLEINMTELANSTVSGFNETTIHTLPLESTSALVSLLLSVTFKPQILLGIRTVTGSITGGIGGYLSLPTLTVNVTQLANVDQNCKALSNSSAEGAASSALDNLLGNYTSIVPSVDLEVGALANFELELEGFHETAATQVGFASTSYALATACVDYDPAKQTYGTPAAASATATGSGSASHHNSGESRCSSDSAGLRRLAAVAAVLVSAGFCGWA